MDAFTLVLQAPLGQIQVAHDHVVVGRGVAGIPSDPRISRQHVVIAFDPRTGSISATWMARQRGRLHSRGRSTELECGAQTQILPDDVITLLADCGKRTLPRLEPASTCSRSASQPVPSRFTHPAALHRVSCSRRYPCCPAWNRRGSSACSTIGQGLVASRV